MMESQGTDLGRNNSRRLDSPDPSDSQGNNWPRTGLRDGKEMHKAMQPSSTCSEDGVDRLTPFSADLNQSNILKRQHQDAKQEAPPSKIQKRDGHVSPLQQLSETISGDSVPLSPRSDSREPIPELKQEAYRCPRCTFPCWLCHRKDAPARPKTESSDGDESDMSTTDKSDPGSKSSQNKRKRTDGLTYLGPKDKDFESLILRPSGVWKRAVIDPSTPEDPPDDGVQDDPSRQCEVYLQIDDSMASRISAQFYLYHERKYDEVALTQLMTKWLARLDDYVDPNGPTSTSSLRRDRWKPGKEGPHIPSALRTKYIYDWDIEPDITYMLALNLFSDDVRKCLQLPSPIYWLAAEPLGVCPYLTLELKCAEKTGKDSEAQYQISVASVLWLYQWERLKREIGSSSFVDLRHYSVIVNSLDYTIWVTKFNGATYSVNQIKRGSFGEPEGVRQYAKWSNAIHKWGLGTNARAFKRDVKALLEKCGDAGSMLPPLTRGAVQSLPE